jgi:hypothetical protein
MAGDRELKAMQTTLEALQSLDTAARQRVLDWLAAKLSMEAPAPGGGAGGDHRAPAGGGKLGTIKQFLKLKAPNNDVRSVTALAYFLTHGTHQAVFKTADLGAARIDAALTKFGMPDAVAHAQRAGYLTTAAKRGTYQITTTGEELVDAMPDAAAVKQVNAQSKKRRRKPSGTKRTAAKKGAAKKA